MAISNIAKNRIGLGFVANYLDAHDVRYQVHEDGMTHYLYVEGAKKRVRVFCNYSRQEQIKVSVDFEPDDETLYLVVSPTERNSLGFSCVGGYKEQITNSFKLFSSQSALKNISVKELKPINILKHIQSKAVPSIDS